jgi:hypothetical protein
MDEALEAVELAADVGLEGVISWLLRVVGLVAVLAGLGLWLVLGWDLLFVPAGLLVVGAVLLVVPSLVMFALEFA